MGLMDVIQEKLIVSNLKGNDLLIDGLNGRYINESISGWESDKKNFLDAINTYNRGINQFIDLFALPPTYLINDTINNLLEDIAIFQPKRIDSFSKRQYYDFIRFLAASDRKGKAYIELVERQFREYTEEAKQKAKETISLGIEQSMLELFIVKQFIPDSLKDFEGVLRSIEGNNQALNKIFNTINQGLNPLGFTENYIPLSLYDTDRPNQNLFEQIADYSEQRVLEAEDYTNRSRETIIGKEQSNEQLLNSLQNTEQEFNRRAGTLCGFENIDESKNCIHNRNGAIGLQWLNYQVAQLNAIKKEQELENIDSLIFFEQERLRKIHEAQDDILRVETETKEVLLDLAEEEEKIRKRGVIFNGITNLINIATQPEDHAKDYSKILSTATQIGTTINEYISVGEYTDIEKLKIERAAINRVTVLLAEKEITEANSVNRIKELLLSKKVLEYEEAIALLELESILLGLQNLISEYNYVVSEYQQTKRHISASVWADPSYRLVRDRTTLIADRLFDSALKDVYKAGKAVEYMLNMPNFKVRDIENIPSPDNGGLGLFLNLSTIENSLNDLFKHRTTDNLNLFLSDLKKIHREVNGTKIKNRGVKEISLLHDVYGGNRDSFQLALNNPQNWDNKGNLELKFSTSLLNGLNIFGSRLANQRITGIEAVISCTSCINPDRSGYFILYIKQAGINYLTKITATAGDLGEEDFNAYQLKISTYDGVRINSTDGDTGFKEHGTDPYAINKELNNRGVLTDWVLKLYTDGSIGDENINLQSDDLISPYNKITDIRLRISFEADQLR